MNNNLLDRHFIMGLAALGSVFWVVTVHWLSVGTQMATVPLFIPNSYRSLIIYSILQETLFGTLIYRKGVFFIGKCFGTKGFIPTLRRS